MVRPLRIEYSSAVYHITARGNERKPIFRDEYDFQRFIDILKETEEKGSTIIYGYVLAKLFDGVHYSAISQIVRGIRKRSVKDKNLAKAIRTIEDKL